MTVSGWWAFAVFRLFIYFYFNSLMCPNGWWGYGNTRKHDYFHKQGVRDNFLSTAHNLAAIKALIQRGLQNTVGTTKTAKRSTSN